MRQSLPRHKLETAKEMHDAISRIFAARSEAAQQSQYDVMVCIRAVSAARDVFESVAVEGAAVEYGQAVVAALSEIHDSYHDPDGEYTSGRAPIGDVYYDVSNLLDSQMSSEVADVDRDEAYELLTEEMNTLARLTPQPVAGVIDATVKADVLGTSGTHYLVEMVFEQISDERFAILGRIYDSNSHQFPLLEERSEFDVGDDT